MHPRVVQSAASLKEGYFVCRKWKAEQGQTSTITGPPVSYRAHKPEAANDVLWVRGIEGLKHLCHRPCLPEQYPDRSKEHHMLVPDMLCLTQNFT